MKVFSIDPTANKFHDSAMEASGHGESAGEVRSAAEVVNCGWAQEYAKRHGVDGDLLQELDDERCLERMARIIVDDERISPFWVEILFMALRIDSRGKRTASLVERQRIWRDYQEMLSWKVGR